MQTNNAILEYCFEENNPAGNGSWSFKLTSPEGETLMESSQAFETQSEAEKGFVSMVKLIASNHYTVSFGHFPA